VSWLIIKIPIQVAFVKAKIIPDGRAARKLQAGIYMFNALVIRGQTGMDM